MFERFTIDARTVLRTAGELIVGSRQDHIEPINLVLALFFCDDLTARVLVECGFSRALAKTYAEASDGFDPLTSPRAFAPQAKKVLEWSLRESLQLGHNYIGPLHILLAIARNEDSRAALSEFHVDPGRVRDATLRAFVHPEPAPRQDKPLDAELAAAVRGVPLLAVGGLPLSLALMTDLIRLTGGGEPRDSRLRALRSDAGIGRLRALNWRPSARVGFAGLLAADLPRDATFIAPNMLVQELSDALHRSVSDLGPEDTISPRLTRTRAEKETAIDRLDFKKAAVLRDEERRLLAMKLLAPDDLHSHRTIQLPDELAIDDLDDDAVELLNDAAAAVTDQTVLMLEILGEETVATKPTLPLQVRHLISSLPQISVRHRGLLSANTAAAAHLQRQTATQGAMGGVNGITRHGRLVNLLPSQLALPSDLFIARMAESELLYRLRHTDPETPPRNVTIVLDTSPPTFGPIETVLRMTAHVLITTLWEAQHTPSLVTVDQPGLVRRIEDREGLVGVWTSRTLEPAGMQEAVATARRVGEPVVVLTHHHAPQDVPLKPSADLRLLTTHVLDDVPTKWRSGGVHIHLEPSPKPTAIAQAVLGLLRDSAASA